MSFTIVVSSCKKEDEVVPDPVEINGCTDLAAMNYLSNANFDDGSCVYESEPLTINYEIDGNSVTLIWEDPFGISPFEYFLSL